MTVITSQILDISTSSPITFRQWANNTNKIVTDVVSINNEVVAAVAEVDTLSSSVTSLSSNVSSLSANVTTIKTITTAPNIVALSGLSDNGIIAKTGTSTVASRTITAPAAGITISNGNGVSGNPTLVLANDLAALESLASTGIAVRTAADTWAQRTITAPAAGITISNGNGVSGNPTLALANDLAALEAFSSTGFAVRTATDTWSQRTIVGPAAGVTVTNGTGVSGNPTIALTNDLAALEGLAATGFASRISTDSWAQRSIVGTAPVTITNGDGVSGNPTISVAEATAAQYRSNTVDRVLTTDEVWSAAAEVTLADGATIAVDFSTFINAVVTLGGNRAMGNPTNEKVGQTGCIRIVQDGTGSRTLTYGTDWEFAGGVAPTLSTAAGTTDLLFYYIIAADRIFGNLVLGVA